MNTHVMLDVETLGTTADSVVLTIGAIAFSPNTMALSTHPQFYRRLAYAEQTRDWRRVTRSTLEWWTRQNNEASNEALSESLQRVSFSVALLELAEWMPENACVWGYGADFDNAILQHAWQQYHGGKPLLWPYRNNRCLRTFVAMFDPYYELATRKNDHHALNDCYNQIQWMARICEAKELTIR